MTEETVNNETVATQEEAKTLPEIRSGMVIRVHEKIKDVNAKGEERERIQIFEGIVIGIRGSGLSRTMTVRKNSDGVMVEKIYPVASPNIANIEVVKRYRTRRKQLSHLRDNFKRKLKEVKAK